MRKVTNLKINIQSNAIILFVRFSKFSKRSNIQIYKRTNLKRELEITNIYDGQFSDNILVVGKTGCGKTYFLQNLDLRNFFGEIVKTEWISGIEISKLREAEIESCFSNEVEFYQDLSADDLKRLIETFKLRTEDSVENDDENINGSVYGEKKIMDRLIVMDDLLAITDLCKEFFDFLSVS